MRRLKLLAFLLVAISAATAVAAPPTPEKLPRWRGFNLLEKFTLGGGQKPFLEDDFRMISQLGFNLMNEPFEGHQLDRKFLDLLQRY